MLSISSMQTNTRAHMQLMHAHSNKIHEMRRDDEKFIMCCMSHAVDIMTRHTEGDRVDLQLTPWVEMGNMLA